MLGEGLYCYVERTKCVLFLFCLLIAMDHCTPTLVIVQFDFIIKPLQPSHMETLCLSNPNITIRKL